jgi:hypothetical protein
LFNQQFFLLSQKSNKRLMAGTITRETKKGRPKDTARRNQKKWRELVPLILGSYLTHGPSKLIADG